VKIRAVSSTPNFTFTGLHSAVQRVATAEQKKTKIRPLSKDNIGIFPAGNPAGNEYCYESVAECGPDVVDWPLMKRSTSCQINDHRP